MIEAKLFGKTTFRLEQRRSSYLTWGNLINYVKGQTCYTEEEKGEIIEAYQYLSLTLNKGFLQHCQNYSLKIGQNFFNQAPWAVKWSVWLSKAIKVVQQEGHLDFIIDKLKSKHKYHEGIVFLEISHLFHLAGFKFSFEHEVLVNGKAKRPDIKLHNPHSKENIYLEVSELNQSDEHFIGKRSFDIISNRLLLGKVAFCGKIGGFDKSRTSELLEILDKGVKHIIDNESFIEINEKPLHIGLAPSSTDHELKRFAETNQFQLGSLTGDTVCFKGDIKRIKNKIQLKANQLGELENNLILIHVHALLFFGISIYDLMMDLAKELEKYPKLCGLLIYGDLSLAKEENHLAFHGHLISTRIFEHVDKKTFVFVKNNHHVSSLSQESFEKIYSAFKFGKEIVLTE